MQNEVISLIVILNVLLGLIFFFTNRRIKRQASVLQLHSIELNELLKKLLTGIQKQRGICARLLNGEHGLKQDVASQVKNNDQQFNDIEYSPFNHFLVSDPRWNTIRNDWASLKSQVTQVDKDESFLRHCNLIEKLIFMIGDIAERGQDHSQRYTSQQELMVIWTNIPKTLEALGQARAIGSGAASAGFCNQASKIKLKFLREEIQKNYSQINSQINLGNQDDLASDIEAFLTTINHKLIAPEKPEIDAQTYFDQASDTMNSLSVLFDRLSETKKQLIRL